jgi:hypothetical protein
VSIEGIEENSLTELRAIKKKIQDCFQNWKNRWEPCFKSGGEYFGGDKADWLLDKCNKVLSKKFGNFLNRPCVLPQYCLFGKWWAFIIHNETVPHWRNLARVWGYKEFILA